MKKTGRSIASASDARLDVVLSMLLVPIFVIPFAVTFVGTLLAVGAIMSPLSDLFHLERTTGWVDAVKQIGAVVVVLGVPLAASVAVTRFLYRHARRLVRRITDRLELVNEDPALIQLMPEEVAGQWMHRASWRLETLEIRDPRLHEMLTLIAHDQGVIPASCSAATMAIGEWPDTEMSVRVFRSPTATADGLRDAFGAGDAETEEWGGWTLSRPAFDQDHPLASALVMGEPWPGDVVETFLNELAIYLYFQNPDQLTLLLGALRRDRVPAS